MPYNQNQTMVQPMAPQDSSDASSDEGDASVNQQQGGGDQNPGPFPPPPQGGAVATTSDAEADKPGTQMTAPANALAPVRSQNGGNQKMPAFTRNDAPQFAA